MQIERRKISKTVLIIIYLPSLNFFAKLKTYLLQANLYQQKIFKKQIKKFINFSVKRDEVNSKNELN